MLRRRNTIAGALRSPSLAPFALAVLPAYYREPYVAVYQPTPELDTDLSRADAFARLAQARRQLLLGQAPRNARQHVHIEHELQRSQALLLAGLGQSLDDGAAEGNSLGYIDIHDVPPWDTWLCLVDIQDPQTGAVVSCLLSWVPAWAATLVDRACAVVTHGVLSWATYTDGAITPVGWGKRWPQG